MTESEKLFIFQFRDNLLLNLENRKEYKISIDDNWELTNGIALFDLVVYRRENPFAVFDFEFRDINEIDLNKKLNSIRLAVKITKARYGILVSKNEYYLLDKGNKLDVLEILNFEKLISYLNNPKVIQLDYELKKLLANVILNRANELDITDIKHKQNFISFLQKNKLEEKIHFDSKSNSFVFFDNNKNLDSFENQLFNNLLGEFKETRICRYTSLKSLFTSLNNTSYRMNGLVGMNDKTEVNYVDNYLNDYPIQFHKLHHNRISAINKRFISSCSLMEMADKLTMWRLYGDDCKGICQLFKINKLTLNNHTLLQKVSYAKENNIHPLLEFLKWIKRDIEDVLGLNFELSKLRYWKHFFKPFDYSVENEVRLLVIDSNDVSIGKRDWVLTDNHSILNPVIDIKLNHPEFPLILDEIILGPKCPEADINKVQIEELLRIKKPQMTFETKTYQKINVRISNIQNYR
jgi:hypothetical protein